MSKRRNTDYLYDGCETLPQDLGFCVASGKPKVLMACNLPEGAEIPIEFAFGNPVNDCWCPLAGVGPLTATDNVLPITMPGTFQLDISGLPEGTDPCIKVVCQELEEEDAKCILGPFTTSEFSLEGPLQAELDLTPVTALLSELLVCFEELKDREAPKPDSVSYMPVPFQEVDTCIPLMAEIRCEDGEFVTPYPLGYVNETGVFTVSTSFEPYVPSAAAETCAQAQASMVVIDGDGADQDVATIAAALIAASGAEFVFDGKAPVAALPEDLSNITIIRKPCGALDSADAEVTIDYFTVNGAQVISYTDDKDGGVDGAALVNVPVGACVLVSACFEQCLSKADLAALPADLRG